MKVILGLLKPRSGDVILDGETITGLPTPQIIRRGLGSVPEARRLFGAMTVRENVLMGAFTRNDKAEIAQDYARMMTLFPRLAERTSQARRHALRRRAADGRDGARPDGAPARDRAWTSRPWASRRCSSIACWS